MKRTRPLLLPTVLYVALSLVPAQAQGWPAKPLRAIVPIAAGSSVDLVARVVCEQISAQLGQGIVVEDRPGAGQTIGAGFVAKSDSDGYTLLVNSSAHAIAPALHPNLNYDPVRDFVAVAPLGVTPFVLVVNPERKFKDVGDLVAAAKAKPGSFNYSSPGVGTGSHLSAERFRLSAGIDAVHVPFKGGVEAMTEVVAGRIDFFFVVLGAALPFIRDGKLTPLAVNGTQRAAALPDVPTLAEAGFKNAANPTWFGLFLPAQTPRDIIATVRLATIKALAQPKVLEKLTQLGVDPLAISPEDFAAFVADEVSADAQLVKAIGLKAE
jgi:tripartite-type tricarboxylate transporter receptor subunit TctC